MPHKAVAVAAVVIAVGVGVGVGVGGAATTVSRDRGAFGSTTSTVVSISMFKKANRAGEREGGGLVDGVCGCEA